MTLSNKLTLSRIAVIPGFILLMSFNNSYSRVLALVIFIFAAITDLYDGRLARKYGQVTKMGQFLDPLADKMIVTAALISFIRIEDLSIPAWIVIIIIAREFIINDLRDLAISNGVIITVSKGGKWKTVIQMVSITTILLLVVIKRMVSNVDWFNLLIQKTIFWLMIFTMVVTVVTGLDYLIRGARELLEKKVFSDS